MIFTNLYSKSEAVIYVYKFNINDENINIYVTKTENINIYITKIENINIYIT